MKEQKIESEKLVERRLVEYMKEKKCLCIKLLSNHMQGVPDRLCLFPNGVVVFVELKTTGRKPRPIQLYVHKILTNLGFRVFVIDTVKDAIDMVDDILNLPF